MAEYNNQKYYWIKLTDKFLTSDTVDFLLSQKDGANYVVLYQMLCLKTVNNDGVLARKIGELIIPYDEEKIERDCKHFSIDTIRVALSLYKKLGLIYEQDDGILKITDFERLIGSQTVSAYKKEIQIKNRGGTKVENIPPDIDNRYKDIDIDNNIKENIKEKKSRYGQFKQVLLTDKEYQKLLNDYPNGQEAIDYLDYYIKMKGYTAKSHYLAIKKWVFDAVERDKQNKTYKKENKSTGYEDF